MSIALLCGYVICILVGLFGVAVLWRIADGTINLARLISEPNGDASMSRFQFLVFTFVIALSLFYVIVSQKKPDFPVVPGTILSLLGISGSSYLVSKGIQFSSPAGVQDRGAGLTVVPARPVAKPGEQIQFRADVPGSPGSKVTWAVVAGPGTIDPATGLYTAPGPGTVPVGQRMHATIQATSTDHPDLFDLAVVTLI